MAPIDVLPMLEFELSGRNGTTTILKLFVDNPADIRNRMIAEFRELNDGRFIGLQCICHDSFVYRFSNLADFWDKFDEFLNHILRNSRHKDLFRC